MDFEVGPRREARTGVVRDEGINEVSAASRELVEECQQPAIRSVEIRSRLTVSDCDRGEQILDLVLFFHVTGVVV